MEKKEFLAIVDEILEVDIGTTDFEGDLEAIDWDSLANLGFIAEIDSRLGVRLNAEDLAKCRSVADLYLLLTK